MIEEFDFDGSLKVFLNKKHCVYRLMHMILIAFIHVICTLFTMVYFFLGYLLNSYFTCIHIIECLPINLKL